MKIKRIEFYKNLLNINLITIVKNSNDFGLSKFKKYKKVYLLI